MKDSIVFSILGIVLVSFTIGCGTDLKPTAFTSIISDSDIDELSACLTEEPELSDETISLTLNNQCLVDFSNRDQVDPNLSPSFAEIVADPEKYMDKLLTFEAVTKKVSDRTVELYTNDRNLRFNIHTHGAALYRLDEEGEEVPIEPNETYRFRCRIYHYETRADSGQLWTVNAEFIVSTSKKIIHLPELVE